MSQEKESLTISAAAKELGIHRDTLRRWINQGLVETEARPSPNPNAKSWRFRIPRPEVERLKAGH